MGTIYMWVQRKRLGGPPSLERKTWNQGGDEREEGKYYCHQEQKNFFNRKKGSSFNIIKG